VLYNNVIYFAGGTNLYKRTVTSPASLATCGTSYYKQTCPADHTSSTCPQDVLLTDHLNNFTITYYDSNGTTTNTPESAESIQVTIGLHDKAYAEDIYANTSLRLRKLNQ
jgi:hypothetical protein